MDRNSVNWSGPMPAVTTPFDDAGRIDERSFSDNIGRLLDALENFLAIAKLSVTNPGCEPRDRLVVAVFVVPNQEPLHPR